MKENPTWLINISRFKFTEKLAIKKLNLITYFVKIFFGKISALFWENTGIFSIGTRAE